MKLTFVFAAAMIGVTAAAAWGAPQFDEKQLAAEATDRFPQPVVAGTLIGCDVLQPVESQRVLGHVRELVRQNGNLYVVVDYGGWFGVGGRPIAVPADGMALLGRSMQIVAFKPAQLDTFTTFDAAHYAPVNRGETVEIGLAKPAH